MKGQTGRSNRLCYLSVCPGRKWSGYCCRGRGTRPHAALRPPCTTAGPSACDRTGKEPVMSLTKTSTGSRDARGCTFVVDQLHSSGQITNQCKDFLQMGKHDIFYQFGKLFRLGCCKLKFNAFGKEMWEPGVPPHPNTDTMQWEWKKIPKKEEKNYRWGLIWD